jgi:DNA-binding TFAR19-related protein (PDSD5 family)
LQLIQAFQSGAFRGRIPLTDDLFKQLLKQLHNQTQTRETKIKFR